MREKNFDKLKYDIVIKDIEFESPSGAAQFVGGGAANGKIYWRTQDGQKLNDFIKYIE